MECNHGPILTAVYAMRQAQKQYFRTRGKAILEQSKQLEREVDNMLLEAATGTQWVEKRCHVRCANTCGDGCLEAKQPRKGPHVAPTPGLFESALPFKDRGEVKPEQPYFDTCGNCANTRLKCEGCPHRNDNYIA